MTPNDFLETDASSGRVSLAARVALAHCHPGVECPRYLEALVAAIRDEPPPFDTEAYAEIYRHASEDGAWTAVSLITNAEREGDGAKRLWSLAACSDDPGVAGQLKSHAVDESGHAALYLLLLDLTFPGAAPPPFRRELQTLSPGFTIGQPLAAVSGSPYAKKPTIDDFLQMNVAEVRTAIHHIMQRPALAMHCPPDKLERVRSVQDSLLRDELKHVGYTAVLIEREAREMDQEALAALFRRRFRDFNRITTEELEGNVFDCSVACCAQRPWCRSHSGAPPAARAPSNAPAGRGLHVLGSVIA